MSLKLRLGLTGGIAAGKSTVLELFAARGVPVLDADDVARKVVRPGTPALAELVAHLGEGILDPHGALERAALRRRIFRDPALRRIVEGVIHPRVRAAMLEWAAATDAPYGILCVPLLFESGMESLVDRVLVVDVPEALQVARVMARDGSDAEAARAVLASQLSRDERLARADDVIDNSGDQKSLIQAVEGLHRRYLGLAGSHLPARHE